ncbi:hypothetical protein P7B02_18535 [Caulobacter segnis]|uniref:hypothetical protein n=1 Tax=Caulobacter segnis TaxID=88688 RepID=UPI00240EC01D|nr:hypothetical protein [Caulobacter segnis]MDG2523530.1 hypothetical protein [Caulobacter segnis]
MRGTRRRTAPATLAVAISVALHLVFIAIFVAGLVQRRPPPSAPIVTVELFRLPMPEPARPLRRAAEANTARQARAASEPPAQAAIPEGVPALPPAVAAPDSGALARQALRNRMGCLNLAQMPEEARRRCEERLAQLRTRNIPVDLSKGGRFAPRDEIPYLNRRPKNGCKPRAAGSATPEGDEGAAMGIDCRFSF